jgi:hypothetical protein
MKGREEEERGKGVGRNERKGGLPSCMESKIKLTETMGIFSLWAEYFLYPCSPELTKNLVYTFI